MVALTLAGCLTSGGEGENHDETAERGDLAGLGTYTYAANRLTLAMMYFEHACDTVTNRPVPFFSGPFVDDDSVSLEGNELIVWNGGIDTARDEADNPLAAILYGERHVREGGGSGIQGVWRNAGRFHRVLWGTPSAEYAAYMKNDSVSAAKYFDYRRSFREFTADSVRLRRNMRWADEFIALWNGDLRPDGDRSQTDSARFAMRVTKIDQHTVRLQGLTTGEVVTYWRDNLGGERFSSNRAERVTFEYIPALHACKTEIPEHWFHDFLQENSRFPRE
jgi:hypothetical protein